MGHPDCGGFTLFLRHLLPRLSGLGRVASVRAETPDVLTPGQAAEYDDCPVGLIDVTELPKAGLVVHGDQGISFDVLAVENGGRPVRQARRRNLLSPVQGCGHGSLSVGRCVCHESIIVDGFGPVKSLFPGMADSGGFLEMKCLLRDVFQKCLLIS